MTPTKSFEMLNTIYDCIDPQSHEFKGTINATVDRDDPERVNWTSWDGSGYFRTIGEAVRHAKASGLLLRLRP